MKTPLIITLAMLLAVIGCGTYVAGHQGTISDPTAWFMIAGAALAVGFPIFIIAYLTDMDT